MHHQITPMGHRERGVAALLLLSAMSAFAVLGVAALTTGLGGAVEGRAFSIFQTISRDALTHFIAPLVVPNTWRAEGVQGSYQFQLPVVVPETGGDESGATSSWHEITEVPGMAVCCEGRAGACVERYLPTGGARIADWNPGPDDALRLSFDLTSRPDADASKGDMVTATVRSAGSAVEGSSLACQLEFDGAVIAKGTAVLRQEPRQADSSLTTELVVGTMTLAVRTR